jgi:glycosyltransferase involved in cell wall biosynthesis
VSILNNSGVSIVICCYNSAARLPATLEHIWKQKPLLSGGLEVVIVDNCCSDQTVSVVERSHRSSNVNLQLRLVRETTPGLTQARIRGIRSAAFDTIVLCDDDNWLKDDYCQIADTIMTEHPDVGLAGGCSIAVPEVVPPDWFQLICGAWAVGASDYVGYLEDNDGFLRGAGMVVRKSAFLHLLDSGFQFVTSDRKGSSLNSGGDAEICREISRLGYRLYFDKRLSLQHWIPANRLTRDYALRLWEGFGAGTISSDADRIASHLAQSFRNWVRSNWAYQVTRGSCNLLRHLLRHPAIHLGDPRPALGWCSMLGRTKAIWQLKSKYRTIVMKKVDWISNQRTPVRADEK